MSYQRQTGLLLGSLLVAASLLPVAACASRDDTPAPAPKVANVAPATPSPEEVPTLSFAQWRDSFRQEALAAGISTTTFDRAFAGVDIDPAVIRADRSQPEFTRPIWEYLDGALSPIRVAKGQQLLNENGPLLHAIEQRYGVDRQALVAIWGMESNFGQIMGDKSVIRSLATLAYEGRRPVFAQQQLLSALRILQHGDVRPERMIGSWAGAMGQTQFIPTTYDSHAVDFDNDGRRDIWDSSADALASAAHYLQASGWQMGQPWGFQVELPKGFDYALADPQIRKPVSEWHALGVKGAQASAEDPRIAQLLLPAGHRGPAFLVLDNFRAILRYNNSTAYAMAVGLLSQRFGGAGQVNGEWPRGDRPLSRSERIELQQRLAAAGFDPGAADSIIGANTRQAIRAYQQQLGWPADGYAEQHLLEALRQQ